MMREIGRKGEGGGMKEARGNNELTTHRRVKFDSLLNDYQNEVDNYKEKEVPRAIEEVKEVLAQLEKLGRDLEAAREESMVSPTHRSSTHQPLILCIFFAGHQQ